MEDKTLQFALYLCAHFPPLVSAIEGESAGEGAMTRGLILYKAAQTVAGRIRGWWAHWQQHPDFESIQGACPSEEWNPHVVGVWQHPPGVQGKTESYYLSTLQDVTSPQAQRWCGRIFGQFRCIRPYPHDWPTHPIRAMYLSNSLLYGGKGYQARQTLKNYLPRKYHPLITFARKASRAPKTAHLGQWKVDHAGENWRNHSDLPAWYKAKTRDQLNEQNFLERYAGRLAGLEAYITPHDFWLAAPGKIHPDDVASLLTYQTDFFQTFQTFEDKPSVTP